MFKKFLFFSILLSITVLIGAACSRAPAMADLPADKTIFFWGNGCSHCATVEKYFADNNVKDKIQFDEKEVWYNKDNAALMGLAAQKCQLDTSKGMGVPFLWIGPETKCLIGDQPIIDYYNQKLGLSAPLGTNPPDSGSGSSTSKQ